MSARGTMLGPVAFAAVLAALSGCGLNGLTAVSGPPDSKEITGPVQIELDDPVLRWQKFPRQEDAQVFGTGAATRITNVRYDLRFWSPTSSYTWATEPTMVTGLSQPEYRFAGLKPGDRYRWATRATFELDGRPRVTQWTSTWAPPPVWDRPDVHPLLEVVDR